MIIMASVKHAWRLSDKGWNGHCAVRTADIALFSTWDRGEAGLLPNHPPDHQPLHNPLQTATSAVV
jgi:hypothetical protein